MFDENGFPYLLDVAYDQDESTAWLVPGPQHIPVKGKGSGLREK